MKHKKKITHILIVITFFFLIVFCRPIGKTIDYYVLMELRYQRYYDYFFDKSLTATESGGKQVLEAAISKTVLEKVSFEEFKVFFNALKYRHQRQYSSASISFMDGTGLYIKDCNPNNIVYGKMGVDGRILEKIDDVVYEEGFLTLSKENVDDTKPTKGIYGISTNNRDWDFRDIYLNGDIYSYLDYLSRTNYLIVIASKEDSSLLYTRDLMERMQLLGLEVDLSRKYANSYLAIINPDKQVITEISTDSNSEEHTFVEGEEIYAKSISRYYGGDCSIKINGCEYAQDGRGLNIVVFDMDSNTVIDSVVFDCYRFNGAYRN